MQYPETTISKNFPAIRIALIILCLFAGFTTSTQSIAAPDDELRKLRKALTASSARQEEISARLQLLSSEIRSLKEKTVRVASRLINIDRKMITTQDRLVDIQNIEKQTLRSLAQQNKGLADTLSALLQLSRQPEGSLIGSPKDLVNNLRTATLLKAAIAALKNDADSLNDQLETLASLRDQYLAEQNNYQVLKSSRLSEQETLNSLLVSKRSAQTSLSGLNSKEDKFQKKLSSDAQNLVALISNLEKRKQFRLQEERLRVEQEIARQEKLRRAEAKRKAEEARQLALAEAQKQTQKKPDATVVNIPKPPASRKSIKSTTEQKSQKSELNLAALTIRKSISRAKGTLALPVGGKIISKYNSSKDVGKRNGIVIETRGSATVISPYDGQIAFAGPFRHYGLLLIIDHGEGYHTLLAGMGSIEGSVGQLLLAGEPVGQMKSSNSDKQSLYMELRVKGSPVNPIPWLMAGQRKVSG